MSASNVSLIKESIPRLDPTEETTCSTKAKNIANSALESASRSGEKWKNRAVHAFISMPRLTDDSDDDEPDVEEKKEAPVIQTNDEESQISLIDVPMGFDATIVDTVARKFLTEVEPVQKVKKPKEPFSAKHLAWLISAVVMTLGLSILYRDEPIIAISMMGAWANFIRVAYKSIPQGGISQTIVRLAAIYSLMIAVLSNLYTSKDSVWNSIPFFSFALAILIKCEWNKMGLEEAVSDLFNYNKNLVEVISSTTQGLVSSIFTLNVFPLLVQAPAGTVAKAKFRSLATVYFKIVTKFENLTIRKVVLAASYLILPTVGTLTFLSLSERLVEHPALVLLLSVINMMTFDTSFRLFKNFLWQLSGPTDAKGNELSDAALAKSEDKAQKNKDKAPKPEKSNAKKQENLLATIKRIPKGAVLLALILAASYPMEELLSDKSIPPAIVAVIAGEIGTLFKPLAKRFVGTDVNLAMLIPSLILFSFWKNPFGFETQFARALIADNTLFCMKDKVRPKKLPNVELVGEDKPEKKFKKPKPPKAKEELVEENPLKKGKEKVLTENVDLL